jgi:aspartate/methionine/tyrosine aminotransferase
MQANVEPFHALSISRLAHDLQAQGRSIIHMEFGQPSTGAPQGAIARAHEVLDTDGMGYWESTALKARLARHYRDSYGVEVTPEQFILTCGASPALVLALSSSFSPGDRIALARPGYVAYRNTLRALHLVPVEIPCDKSTRFQLTAASLESLSPAPRGVIVASPANPTGTIIGAAELRAIERVCRDRNIQIISDEIYHGLSYGEPAHSLLEFGSSPLVVNSFSKYFSMVGWRLGWLLVPTQHIERARAYMGNLFLTAPSLSQHAGLIALDSHAQLQKNVAVYARNRALLLAALPALGLEDIAPPDGAFYIYADVHRFTDNSLQFCEAILRNTGVATAPGIDFDPVEGRHFIRLSFAVATSEVEDAIARLRPWLAAYPRSTA